MMVVVMMALMVIVVMVMFVVHIVWFNIDYQLYECTPPKSKFTPK